MISDSSEEGSSNDESNLVPFKPVRFLLAYA